MYATGNLRCQRGRAGTSATERGSFVLARSVVDAVTLVPIGT
jgi:hypothetical protein